MIPFHEKRLKKTNKGRETPGHRKARSIKMSIPHKSICRLSAIPTKVLMGILWNLTSDSKICSTLTSGLGKL